MTGEAFLTFVDYFAYSKLAVILVDLLRWGVTVYAARVRYSSDQEGRLGAVEVRPGIFVSMFRSRIAASDILALVVGTEAISGIERGPSVHPCAIRGYRVAVWLWAFWFGFWGWCRVGEGNGRSRSSRIRARIVG